MKIILSRKGFDCEYGSMPSPILPDGTLLSLPIPDKDGNLTYDLLSYNGKTYSEFIKELQPGIYNKLFTEYGLRCHLDPDIRKEAISQRPKNWIPVFGQCEAAEGHLRKMGVDRGDIFLYFGTFRKTEYVFDNKIRFIPGAPELHIIFGYLQIGKRIKVQHEIDNRYPWHPHSQRNNNKNNTVYIPTEKLSICPGSSLN